MQKPFCLYFCFCAVSVLVISHLYYLQMLKTEPKWFQYGFNKWIPGLRLDKIPRDSNGSNGFPSWISISTAQHFEVHLYEQQDLPACPFSCQESLPMPRV